MARQPRFEYPGAAYHVMTRGDGGKTIFVRKEDHESFLYWLEQSAPLRQGECSAMATDKSRTAVANDRIAQRLAMGHPASMSQLVNRLRRNPKAARQLKKHEKALKSKD